MIPEFEKMLFDYNEGLHHAGLLPAEHYITGFEFFMNILCFAVLAVGWNKIVVWSDWYEEREEFFYERVPTIALASMGVMTLLILGYFEAYGQILFLLTGVTIMYIIATREEFAGFREWFEEKFGWLF